jgi:DNA-binding NarL/FixJ family response regulator
MLEDESDMNVIGEAGSSTDAVELALKLKPQVILMDCALQGESGITATRNIITMLPETAILMLSMHSEETLVRQSLEAGARGYILKNAADLDLASAIRRVLNGDIVLDPQVKRGESLKGERTAGLTARELEILQLIAMGKSNKEIASDLGLSANTVAVHRANIMNALGLHKTAELVVYAIRNGLVNLP